MVSPPRKIDSFLRRFVIEMQDLLDVLTDNGTDKFLFVCVENIVDSVHLGKEKMSNRYTLRLLDFYRKKIISRVSDLVKVAIWSDSIPKSVIGKIVNIADKNDFTQKDLKYLVIFLKSFLSEYNYILSSLVEYKGRYSSEMDSASSKSFLVFSNKVNGIMRSIKVLNQIINTFDSQDKERVMDVVLETGSIFAELLEAIHNCFIEVVKIILGRFAKEAGNMSNWKE